MLHAPLPHPLVARPTGLVMPALSSHSAGSPPTPQRRRRTGVAPASHQRRTSVAPATRRQDRPTDPAGGRPLQNGSDPTSTHSPHRGPLETPGLLRRTATGENLVAGLAELGSPWCQ
jgi:hypothetical protein